MNFAEFWKIMMNFAESWIDEFRLIFMDFEGEMFLNVVAKNVN